MKNYLLITALLLLFTSSTNAQDNTKPAPAKGMTTYGIYGGINFQNINGKDNNGNKLENSLVTKFHIGVNIEFPIAPEFYLQAGIQYMGKGAKGTVLYKDNTGTHEITRILNQCRLVKRCFTQKPLNVNKL